MANVPSSLQQALPLTTPELAAARHPALILAPRALRSWIETLPLANPPRAAEDLRHQLELLISDPDPGNRLGSLLELYEPAIGALLEIVLERLEVNLALATQLDQLEYKIVELLQALAGGYLRIADNRLKAGKSPDAATLFHAMRAHCHATTIRRLHYHPPTAGDWQTLLGIFGHAEGLGISHRQIGPPARPAQEPNTIHRLFYSALVISLCDPNRRLPGEIHRWQRWLADQVDGLQLALLPNGTAAVPIDVSGRVPPLTGARKARPGPDIRYLDCAPLITACATAMPDLEQALRELIDGRAQPEQRHEPRQARNHPYLLMFGLRDIHERLLRLTQGSDDHNQLPPGSQAVQIDQSRDGACFRFVAPPDLKLSVGDPILAEAIVGDAQAANVGFTAVLRRFANLADGQAEIGVEKLRGRLIPVHIQATAGDNRHLSPLALLQQHADSGRLQLLAARGWYRENDMLTITSGATTYRLRMRERSSETSSTVRIEIELLRDPG
jgi:hypothetical protein